jgi:hypothetical protein
MPPGAGTSCVGDVSHGVVGRECSGCNSDGWLQRQPSVPNNTRLALASQLRNSSLKRAYLNFRRYEVIVCSGVKSSFFVGMKVLRVVSIR